MNPFCDKYFTKTRQVAEKANLNPIVKYRIFTRFYGMAALEPMAMLINMLAPRAMVEILETGTFFEPGDTVATVTGHIQDIVELETQWLQWTALPSYCAKQAHDINEVSKDKILLGFAARHLFGPTSVALSDYGAKVGGIKASSTDVGMNEMAFLEQMVNMYKIMITNNTLDIERQGVGTTPHALIALFYGDYIAMAEAYMDAHPNDRFIALIDYNNLEIGDSLKLLKRYDKKLAGVRIDTCGENFAQVGFEQNGDSKYAAEKGVSMEAVRSLKSALKCNGGEHVKLFVSSGFNAEKTERFMANCPSSVDGIGTGSFIPKIPTATADIYEIDGKRECKKGREWGYEKNGEFKAKPRQIFVGDEA